MQSLAFGAQVVESMRILTVGTAADIIDFCTFRDDVFGSSRFDTFHRFGQAFCHVIALNGLYLKDDTLALQPHAHFEFLGVNVVNGRPSLDESKLLASILVPELYTTTHTHNQLQATRPYKLSFVTRQSANVSDVHAPLHSTSFGER